MMKEHAVAAKLIGTVEADGEGGDVFEENGLFYTAGTTMVINEHDEEVVEATRSEDFTSLEALLRSLPQGVRFASLHPEW
jgi:hypothetical protein